MKPLLNQLKPLSALCLLCASLCMPATAQPLTPQDFAELEQAIAALKTQAGLPFGSAIALVHNGKLIYQHHNGYADIQHKLPVNGDTAFYIASATKPFTALAFLLLAQQGKVDLKQSLQQMWPLQKFPNIDASRVTLRQLLSHQSGLDNQPLVWATAYSGIHTPETLKALTSQSVPDPEAKWGEFRYSNVGYNIASLWLDERSGTAWQDHLQQLILKPLGMQHSSARQSKAAKWPLALPYSLMKNQLPLYLQKTDATMHAAGGMFATAGDLATFVAAQLPGTKSLLPANVISQSQQTQVTTDSSYGDFKRSGYAFGWYTGPYKGEVMLHHFGGFPGYSAHLSFIPARQIGLVILHNEDVLSRDLNNLIADYCYGLLLGDSGTKARVKAGFVKLQQKLAQLPAMKQAQQQKIEGRKTLLSLPPAGYVGRYLHPQLGEMIVSLNAQQQLEFRWGALQAIASGFDTTDELRLELVPNSGEVVKFTVNQGKVQQLTLSGMTFSKQR
ncbi:serine hydrolase domain-containing protein [Rheinheimera texasensis]|uniref:serine hydrolase domain-containing protein n=1 Tax=Rheinheimera texasensis TaxID=306205 RepID=UPI0032B1858D